MCEGDGVLECQRKMQPFISRILVVGCFIVPEAVITAPLVDSAISGECLIFRQK
jgi:hypothetical protein